MVALSASQRITGAPGRPSRPDQLWISSQVSCAAAFHWIAVCSQLCFWTCTQAPHRSHASGCILPCLLLEVRVDLLAPGCDGLGGVHLVLEALDHLRLHVCAVHVELLVPA